MKLHVFNPEHDIALACNEERFMLPHAIQEFKTNLGFMPILWAEAGDYVLVDDIEYSQKAALQAALRRDDVMFVTYADLQSVPLTVVDPWGWDFSLRRSLADAGVPMSVLPSDGYLISVRHLSDKRQSALVLLWLRRGIEQLTCGEREICTSIADVHDMLRRYGNVVIKAPWSSSGRGVRYVNINITRSLEGWIRHVLSIQGGVTVEPCYRKIKDFAMEFFLDNDGSASYCGLSVFETVKGRYVGSIVTTEEEKTSILTRFLSEELLVEVRRRILEYLDSGGLGCYTGPLGVDMMIVANGDDCGYLLHPCVEINVRRTMGHVANAFSPQSTDPPRLLRIVHDVNYRLKLETVGNSFVKVI